MFDEVKRVLRDDGVCFVNLGDSRSGSGKGPTGHNGIGDQTRRQGFHDAGAYREIAPKNLLMIPQRFAIGMQERGWIVRDMIVWAKKSAMPESVRDRCTSAWEPIFMFTKQGRYFWDADAVRQPDAGDGSGSPFAGRQGGARTTAVSGGNGTASKFIPGSGANLRNVWHLSPEPSGDEHYAAFPTEIPRRCILAASSEKGQCPACGSPWRRVVEREADRVNLAEGARQAQRSSGAQTGGTERVTLGVTDSVRRATTGWEPSCRCDAGDPVPQTVLDPFGGSGTTGVVADRLGRDAVLIELSPTYAAMCERRIRGDAGMFADVEVVA